jgi:hypothetical protein
MNFATQSSVHFCKINSNFSFDFGSQKKILIFFFLSLINSFSKIFISISFLVKPIVSTKTLHPFQSKIKNLSQTFQRRTLPS